MGRPPAFIFVVRHGNRLDAADKLWHLSSPTPYDPPLTYGGWLQCRAIGQRIADILRESTPPDLTSSTGAPDGQPAPKKRRFKIVIHSSPFLRCVQTSIAISSGIASDAFPLETPRTFEPLPPLRKRTPAPNGSTSTTTTSGTGGDPIPRNVAPKLHKSVLRIDAFLGEWLSPGYFELITPPPSSVMMVAGAKAELLRREDYSSFAHTANHQSAHAHSYSANQLWGASRSNTWSSRPAEDEDLPRSGSQHIPPVGLFNNNSSADGRPMSSNGSMQTPRWGASGSTSMHPPALVGYIAPVPHFAMSSRAPTPTGYVAHARDACVDLDYQWDSMRPPYDWGDGGEFGEEWTSMHRRFRKGLQKLVDWYSTQDTPAEMVTQAIQFKARHSKTNSNGSVVDDGECAIDDDTESDDADEDCIEESVVVLVSHGAGCNALIGAITQQPVLVDVGLASLSVAARRPGKESFQCEPDDEDSHHSKWTGAVHSGHPGGMVPLNKYFEMKMFANSDHLRSVPTTPTTPAPRSSMAAVMGGTRGRHSNSLPGTPDNLNLFGTGVVGQRSTSAGSFHGGREMLTRRPSGTSPRTALSSSRTGSVGITSPNSTGDRASSGFTVGSGVLSFSPPTLSTSRPGHSRPASIGLWSPVSSKDLEEDNFALNDGNGDDENDSDMEILLSFGPESPKPPQPEKKKAPSIRGVSGFFYPSSLSIAHSVDGDHDDDVNDKDSNTLGSGYTAMASTLPRLDTGTASMASGTERVFSGPAPTSAPTSAPQAPAQPTTARAASPASPGLWIHPRLATLSSDEPTHEMAGSKRRWTVNEPPV
ncbi:hypothetical protein SCUCBS95973_004074 [Sporothrix curviconia]|uniref:Phosphoglycerate mutase family protein n=1 Tax=Sporothrix curviconia TaxID=1260050 RepID=A0ABP0BM03_9PEZI